MRSHLADVVDGNEYRALSAAATWASLAPFLDDDDLVAAADHLICPGIDPGGRHPERVTPPICTLEDLRTVLGRGRWPHAPRLRLALERARVGSKSRPEAQLRLGLTAAGLPEPELNRHIWEGDQWLACPDLVYRKYRVCIEYQSAHHRTAQQYDADIDRRRRLQSAGWIVVELTSTHVLRSPQTSVRRVAEALRERGWEG
ncbi:MAG: endonuclease domain-containing protein [Galactobacter sp.]